MSMCVRVVRALLQRRPNATVPQPPRTVFILYSHLPAVTEQIRTGTVVII